GAIDDGPFRFIVEHADNIDSGVEILANPGDDGRPAVARRADLDDEFRADGEVSARPWTARNTLVTVVGDIRPAHGIGAALSYHTRIVRDHTAAIVTFQLATQEKTRIAADEAVARSGHVQRDDPSTDQFRVLAVVRELAVLLGRQQLQGSARHDRH